MLIDEESLDNFYLNTKNFKGFVCKIKNKSRVLLLISIVKNKFYSLNLQLTFRNVQNMDKNTEKGAVRESVILQQSCLSYLRHRGFF